MYVCMYVWYVCMYVCMYVMYVCMYVCISDLFIKRLSSCESDLNSYLIQHPMMLSTYKYCRELRFLKRFPDTLVKLLCLRLLPS